MIVFHPLTILISQSIEKHFHSIQQRVDKISKVEAVSKRDEQIQKLVRIGTAQFLSKYLPEFQTLSEVPVHALLISSYLFIY
jgi:hypothetical protein